ncbi:MAG: UDP-N-acetylmuramyl-tripeptide synthetase [Clostridiales bacterium]|nr:UDP-N-acetylmuramyl-tripeptide synthetase [Clostridiales bacterium]
MYDVNLKHTLAEFENHMKAKGLFVESNLSDKADILVENISFNSKEIVPGTLFICKGIHFRDVYLKDALSLGAFAYVSEIKYDIAGDVPYIIVSDIKEAMAYIADFFYNEVQSKLKIVGITGTKGKTTTTYFIKHILDAYAESVGSPVPGMFSSVRIYDGKTDEPSRRTTPEAFEVHRHFKNMYDSGIEWVVMEVSSQALKYHRSLGVEFESACFTNMGEDHISDIEHSDWDDYFYSKLKLFDQSKAAIVNLNSDHAERIYEEAKKRTDTVLTFGFMPEADVYGYDLEPDGINMKFKVRTKDFDEQFVLNMRGVYNISNALGAIAMAYSMDIPVSAMKKGLLNTDVEGRMKMFFVENKNVTVIVDFAHNGMSLQALCESTVHEFPGSPIHIVYGSPGDKAFGRRKELGSVAGKFAACSYITEDDPGEESPVDISNEIAKHVEAEGGAYKIIIDRHEAIKAAILEAPENGVVLIIGKGAETDMKRGLIFEDCPSDSEHVLEVLANDIK